jgi:aminoglycoside 6'-N-acetyltransferase I
MAGQQMRIEPINAAMKPEWLALRLLLWPDEAENLAGDLDRVLADPDAANFIVRDAGGAAIGFVEVMIRHDYVNGCETSPVAFVEGLFVVEAHRRQGVARALVARVAVWAKERGLTELTSDALLENTQSHALHQAIGFAETERVVYFRKAL